LAASLALAGVATAIGPAAWGPVTAIAGALWVLAAAGVGALCSVLVRPYLARYPALTVGFWAMGASVAVLALAAWTESAPARLAALGGKGWSALAFVGCSSGVGYWLWLWALSRAPASRVTLSLALSPLTALALGSLMLGEPLSLRLLIALGLIGLALAAR
ncbi:MAG: DMT family transporter, partial [Burkholderiales bacterium]|nr:DMT family transporter [Burkholderiales bacterium]